MTHFHRTGQMQLVIAPLMNEHELLTAVYLDNYLTSPENNSYKDMIDIEKQEIVIYCDNQVENASADGAYSKNDKTREYYSTSLNIKILNGQVLNGIMPRAEHDSKKNTEIEKHLSLAQEMTKLFRYGKEYVKSLWSVQYYLYFITR